MDIGYSIGIAGSIASLITLFVAAPSWRSRLVHAIYVLLVTMLAGAYVAHSAQLAEYTEMEKQAQKILASADLGTDGSTRGFILASLSFLEKNKAHFSDTYASAKKLAEASGVLVSKQEEGMERLHQGWRLQDVGSAMRSLLSGIAGNPSKGEYLAHFKTCSKPNWLFNRTSTSFAGSRLLTRALGSRQVEREYDRALFLRNPIERYPNINPVDP